MEDQRFSSSRRLESTERKIRSTMPLQRRYTSIVLITLALIAATTAFVPSHSLSTIHLQSKVSPTTRQYHSLPPSSSILDATHSTTNALHTTHNILAASTLDPSTFLSDVLGGLLSSNAILLVPIVAALAVAGLIAFAIVSYANPADEDD